MPSDKITAPVVEQQEDKANILLVDDNPETLLALEAILEDLGQNVVKAESAKDALRHLLKEEFAVVLLDINMPGMDGFEMAYLIRQRKTSERTPIIFVTAFSDSMFIARGYSLGAVDYILAPVVPEILKAKVSVFVELYKKRQQLKRQAEAQRRQADRLRKLTEASLAITSASSLEAIRQVLTESARNLVGTYHASVTFHNVDREPLAEPADNPDASIDAILSPELKLLSKTNKPLRLTRKQLDKRPAGRVPSLGQGLIVAPLVGRNQQVLGLLRVWDKQVGDMTEEDEVFIVQLAQIASIAIENLISTQAREANRLKDEFLATLSHELRSPLNAILGWIRLLRTDKLPEDNVKRALEVIERNANWQTKLIEDLLDVSRITAGKMELNIRPILTTSVMQSVLDTMQPIAKKKGVKLSATLDASAKDLMGDPDRFQQAVMNLLDNAIKFTPSGGRVDVTLENTDKGVRIKVADTGKGIQPQFLPHVFDRFRQADSTTTRVYGGLGIGLAVVRHIAELHGGQVSVHSEGEGKGATFIMELPLKAMPVIRESKAVPKEKPAPAQWLRDLSGLRVLLVDDEPDARDVIAEILARCGADVHSVASTKEALEAFKTQPPDVVISDISMPHEDGYALIKAVRKLKPEKGGQVPAIALTAFASQVDRSRLLAAGFQMHLPKPIDPTQLPSLLAGLCGRKSAQPVS